MSSLQENLLERAGELQSILDGITEPLVLIDPGFRIRRVNRSTLEFSGQSSFSSIIGKKVLRSSLQPRRCLSLLSDERDATGGRKFQSIL